jgi:aspartokinase-like uncharacterized kinase
MQHCRGEDISHTRSRLGGGKAKPGDGECELLKSVDGIRSGGTLQYHITGEVPTEDVDPFFLRYVLASGVKTIVTNGRKPQRLGNLLNGRKVPGTTIGF